MGKRSVLAVGLLAVLASLVGCAGGTRVNSYLLDDANIGGDASRSLKPVKGILVWPMENIATGTKSKGVETSLTGVLADSLNLRSGFEKVVILEEDQAKDLMARAGEELGLKKKPKAPGDGALIATKLGQLTGTEVILLGRIEGYDEDKVDKATLTVVASAFNLVDAREKAYATLDSFTPVKRVWRTNVKRTSKEGPFNNREGLDDAARTMIDEVVDQIAADMGQGASVSGKAQKQKLAELNDAADKAVKAGEYDKAIATLNEVLKIQPESKKVKSRIAGVEKRKKEAQDKEKAAALRKQVDEIRGKAEAAEKAGELEGAIAEWKKILELDKGNKEATKKVESLEKAVAEKRKAAEEAKAREAAEKAKKEAAEKAAAEKAAAEKAKAVKPAEAPKVEKKVEEAKPVEAPKVEKKIEEAKPVEAPKVEKKVEEAKPVEAPKVEEKPAEAKPAAGDLEAVRGQAMAAFNKEDYAASRDLWKQILEKVPDDKQAKEMLETTEMLLNALK